MSHRVSRALRAVACVEAAKGITVLLVGFGLLSLIHRNIQQYAERLIPHLHLNPANGYPRVFLDLAGQITDARLWLLAGAAVVYAVVRFIEAYGLWYERRWAEWFAALSGGIYIPFEIHSAWDHTSMLALGALLINLAVVAIMAAELIHRKQC